MLAARNGHMDCVRLLLGAGADKEATNRVHRVYLMRAGGLGCVSGFGVVVMGVGNTMF